MKTITALSLFTVALICLSCNKSSQFGTVLKLNGAADVFVNNTWKPLKVSKSIPYHDTIRSTTGSVELGFRNDGRIILAPNTKMIVVDSTFNGKNYIFPIVLSGGILCEVHRDRTDEFSFVVYTPVSYAEAHGTHYHVSYEPATATSNIDVFDGKVTVYSTSDLSVPVQVVPGFTTTIVGAAHPGKPEKIRYNRFRKVGYLFTPDECERYEVAFGLPVGPIPFPGALIAPIPVPVAVTAPIPQAPEPPRGRHHPHSNVNVSVSVNAPMPGFSDFPVVVPPLPPAPPMLVPTGVAAIPVPVPVLGVPVPGAVVVGAHHRSSHASTARVKNEQRHR